MKKLIIDNFFRQLILNFDETNLCSGELLDNKFIVPCNPEEYLSFQYGKDKWKIPTKSDYFNSESIKFLKTWSDEDWINVVRWYKYLDNGEFDHERSLEKTNKHLNKSIKTLPEGSYY